MYITGSYVVSKYSGSSYRDFVEERILTPLGMHSSSLYPDRGFATGRFTQSWSPVSRRRIPFFMPEHTAELIAGAAGVMSTVEDMVCGAFLCSTHLVLATETQDSFAGPVGQGDRKS